MNEINELKKEITKLNHKIKLLMELVDPDNNPFVFHMLESDANKEQVDAVFDLLDKVRSSIKSTSPISHSDFENEIYKIFPDKNGSYGFAEGIINTLNKNGQYTDVFDYYSNNGMNLTP